MMDSWISYFWLFDVIDIEEDIKALQLDSSGIALITAVL